MLGSKTFIHYNAFQRNVTKQVICIVTSNKAVYKCRHVEQKPVNLIMFVADNSLDQGRLEQNVCLMIHSILYLFLQYTVSISPHTQKINRLLIDKELNTVLH